MRYSRAAAARAYFGNKYTEGQLDDIADYALINLNEERMYGHDWSGGNARELARHLRRRVLLGDWFRLCDCTCHSSCSSLKAAFANG